MRATSVQQIRVQRHIHAARCEQVPVVTLGQRARATAALASAADGQAFTARTNRPGPQESGRWPTRVTSPVRQPASPHQHGMCAHLHKIGNPHVDERCPSRGQSHPPEGGPRWLRCPRRASRVRPRSTVADPVRARRASLRWPSAWRPWRTAPATTPIPAGRSP